MMGKVQRFHKLRLSLNNATDCRVLLCNHIGGRVHLNMKVEANVLGGFMGARLSCMPTIQTRTPHKGLYVRGKSLCPIVHR